MKILIAEDDELMLKTLEFRLKRDGHEIYLARDGKAALDLIDQYMPDLVITDILIASANKGQGLGEFLKDGCLCQCINHFNDAAFCLTQGFMPGRCPEILWLLCRLWKGDDFFHRFILL